jgi:RNA polymerase sigma-70 factor (ECF subfamily)
VRASRAEAKERGNWGIIDSGIMDCAYKTDDLEMVERAKKGDRDAFEALYRQNVRRVYALCVRLAGEPSRAEDLVQDVFVRAWRKLALFRGESRFSTWLHSLAVNVALARRRRWGRRERREILIDDPASLDRAARGRMPEDGIDLERAIAALPAGARSVFVLHDVEGYRHEEIAALMGVTAGTSKAQLHRARRLLRERMAL